MIQTTGCLNLLPFHFFPTLLSALVRLLPDFLTLSVVTKSPKSLRVWEVERTYMCACIYICQPPAIVAILVAPERQCSSSLFSSSKCPQYTHFSYFERNRQFLNHSFLFEYDCLAILCYFLLYNKVNQLCAHTSSPPGTFLPSTLIPHPQIITEHRIQFHELQGSFLLATYLTHSNRYVVVVQSLSHV